MDRWVHWKNDPCHRSKGDPNATFTTDPNRRDICYFCDRRRAGIVTVKGKVHYTPNPCRELTAEMKVTDVKEEVTCKLCQKRL